MTPTTTPESVASATEPTRRAVAKPAAAAIQIRMITAPRFRRRMLTGPKWQIGGAEERDRQIGRERRRAGDHAADQPVANPWPHPDDP